MARVVDEITPKMVVEKFPAVVPIEAPYKSRLRARIETLSQDEPGAVEEAVRITFGLWLLLSYAYPVVSA